MIENKKILVTGVGSIGSELVRQLIPYNEVFMLDINEKIFDLYEELRQKGYNIQAKLGDIRDEYVFDSIPNPDLTFHCAALKYVTPSEWTPMDYVKTNIYGIDNLLRKVGGSKIINISTDKVVNAESIMGLTKKIAEKMIKNTGHISVRFGNVLYSKGSVLEIWKQQVEKGESITITDERMTRYMMTIPQACQFLIKATEIGNPGEILIMDMGAPKNILELKNELYGDYPVKIIGIRPGETLNERLMTDEEQKIARKIDNFYII